MKICVESFDVYPKVAFAGTRGSYGVDAVLEFEFGEGWENLSKSVTFYPADGGGAVSVVLGSDTVIKVPSEVMRASGQAKYVISGVNDEDVMISVTGALHVAQTLDALGMPASEVTPSMTAQVLSKLTAAESSAKDAKRAADRCQALVEQYYIDAETVARNAQDATESADRAEDYASIALQAKDETKDIQSLIISDEKCRELAENVRVKQEMERMEAERLRVANYNRLSNAFIDSVQGSTAVRFDDVSPVSHELDVKISGVEDLSAVKLKKYGKNLFNKNSVTPSAYINDANGAVEGYSGLERSASDWIEVVSGAKYFIGYAPTSQWGAFYDENKAYLSGLQGYNMAHVAPVGARYMRITVLNESLDAMQVELGDVATEYEPYVEPTEYTPNADGTVEGVTSLYPTTTLTTDTEGVVIEVIYNKDVNKVVASLEDRIAALEAR